MPVKMAEMPYKSRLLTPYWLAYSKYKRGVTNYFNYLLYINGYKWHNHPSTNLFTTISDPVISSLTPLSGIRIGSGPIHSRQLRGRVTGSGHWDLKKAAPCDTFDRLSHRQLVVEANIRQIGSFCKGFGVIISKKNETTHLNSIHGTGIFTYIYHTNSTKCR